MPYLTIINVNLHESEGLQPHIGDSFNNVYHLVLLSLNVDHVAKTFSMMFPHAVWMIFTHILGVV